jgi:N-acetylglucosamine-6-sulfatase
MRRLPRIKAPTRRKLTARYRCTLASLRAVDRSVERIYAALEAEGELENTVIVFWSDNGYFNGEHRLANKKQLPYEEGLRIPLVVRVGSEVEDGGRLKGRVERPVGNLDLAPTILDYAGGEACKGKRCRAMDGLSMRNLIVRGKPGEIRPRRPLLIEFENKPRSNFTCAYEGVRVPGAVYIEHISIPNPRTKRCRPAKQTELYDLDADPYQLESLTPNRRGTDAARTERRLRRTLNRLRDCRGVEGRDRKPGGGRRFCGSSAG